MAVTFFKETWQGETSRKSGTVRRYERRFIAKTDALTDHSRHVRLHAQCPQIGDAYPLDSLAACIDVDVTHLQDDRRAYEVYVEYSSGVAPQFTEDPLLEIPDREFDSFVWNEVYRKDEDETVIHSNGPPIVYGKAVLNTAMCPFVPGLERERGCPVYRITKNEASFPFATAANYAYVCNSDVWFGFAAGQALNYPITGRQQRKGLYTYWRNTYTIGLKQEGWDHRTLNVGRMRLARNFFPWRHINLLDDSGANVTDDVILNANGDAAVEIGPTFVPNSTHYLTFRPYPRKVFAGVIPT